MIIRSWGTRLKHSVQAHEPYSSRTFWLLMILVRHYCLISNSKANNTSPMILPRGLRNIPDDSSSKLSLIVTIVILQDRAREYFLQQCPQAFTLSINSRSRRPDIQMLPQGIKNRFLSFFSNFFNPLKTPSLTPGSGFKFLEPPAPDRVRYSSNRDKEARQWMLH